MGNEVTKASYQSNQNWSILKNEEYFVIKLTGIPKNDSIPSFELAYATIISKPESSNTIVHCGDLIDLSLPWIRSLVQLSKKIESLNKYLRLINVKPSIVNYMRELGLDKTLKVCATLREALRDYGIPMKKIINVDFINPFLTATMHVLKIQASTESSPGSISMKEDKTKHMGDISGVIGLVSNAFSGSVVISFPQRTFLKIMSRMLGEEYTEINKDIQDGAAELTNMIFGQAKIALNEKGFGIHAAIPSVVTGQNHSVQSMADGPQVVVPFETDVGPFFIEICTTD